MMMNGTNPQATKLQLLQMRNGTWLLNFLNPFLIMDIRNNEEEISNDVNIDQNAETDEEQYDHEGALYFTVIVILFYALGIVFLILSLSRR